MDATLAPDDFGGIYAAAAMPNGQIYVGGTFLSMGGISQSYFARVNADGTLDQTFAPNVNGEVQAISLQSNGQILIGGEFTEVDGIPRGFMARINPDGSLDGPFDPSANAGVQLIYPLSSGQILISGSFDVLYPNGVATGIGVNSFARLNSDGSVDLTFNPNPNGEILAIAPEADGNLILAGEFTNIGSYNIGYVARLLSNGTIDKTFNPNTSSAVYAVAIQSDGKILIGGSFFALEPQTGIPASVPAPNAPTNSPYGAQTVLPAPGVSANQPIYANHIARLNTDGTVDATYLPDPSDQVQAIAMQSDGSVVIGGTFTSVAPGGATPGITRNFLAHIKTDGTLDPTWDPDANGQVAVVQNLANGQILVGGSFTTLQPNGASTPVAAVHMAILNANGTFNPSFTGSASVAANGQVNSIVYEPNGLMMVGGSFSPFGGNPAANLAVFNSDGTPTGFNNLINGPVNSISLLPNGSDTALYTGAAVWLEPTGAVRYAFAASSNGEVLAIAQQTDGKVLIGGTFSNFANTSGTTYLVRLNLDGTVDTTFKPLLNGQVNAIVIQPNGQIVIGGSFTNLLAGTTISYLARLNADGSLDDTYDPSPNLDVTCLALQADGKVIAGGDFTAVESDNTTNIATRNDLARFNTDGTFDTAFNPDPSGAVAAIAVLSSGNILVGGDFNTINPNLGTAVIQGSLVELKPDGTLVSTFDPNPQGPVSALALQADGKILVSGTFNELNPGQSNTTTVHTATPTGSLVTHQRRTVRSTRHSTPIRMEW